MPEAALRARPAMRSRLHEQVEHARQQLRRDADAVVAHADHRARRPRARPRRRIRPPPVGVLGRVVEQVDDDLREPHRVAVEPQRRLGGSEHVELGAAASISGRLVSTARSHDRRQLDALAAQLDLAARDARHVEQVVDQPHQVVDLALDDLARRADRRRGRSARSRSKRVARSARAGCAARGRASRGTRPCAGRLRGAPRARSRAPLGGRAARAAPDARQELARAERLDEVVVRAGLPMPSTRASSPARAESRIDRHVAQCARRRAARASSPKPSRRGIITSAERRGRAARRAPPRAPHGRRPRVSTS